jgi:hypothetical protein
MTVRLRKTRPNSVSENNSQRWLSYSSLHRFLSSLTADKLFAERLTIQVHNWILMYHQSLRGLKVRKHKGHIIIEPSTASKKAAPDLQRLLRAKSSYAWAKAWHEQSPVSAAAIAAATDGRMPRHYEHPDFLFVPVRDDIVPLVDIAIKIVREKMRTSTTAKPERDRAVIAILRAYRYLTGKPLTAKPAEAFVSKVEDFYNDLLPRGFEGWRSRATLQKLISKARFDV